MLAIETQNLTMEYTLERGQKKKALQNLTLQIPCGKVFGFLGHNGAGKTTTIKILMDLCRPTKGWARIYGISTEVPASRKSVGFLPEEPGFYDYLTALESLESCCRLHGIPSKESKNLSQSAIQEVGLEGNGNRPVFTFSKGMKQRLAIAHAFAYDPDILILDEPMSGLDPEGRRMLRDKMLSWKERGKTIFFTSHILSDVEHLCEEVAFLYQGKAIAMGKTRDFLKQQPIFVHISLHKEQIAGIEFPFPLAIEPKEEKIAIILQEQDKIEKMKSFLQEKKIFPLAWIPEYETLEECYFRLMKEKQDEDSCHCKE